MQPPKFRKDWSGGYDNFTRPITKMNNSNFKLLKKRKFFKRRSNKKMRNHSKSLLKLDINEY